MILMLLITGLVFGGIFGFKWFGNRMMNQYFDTMPVPPVAVTATEAREETWPASLSAVGTVAAVNGIVVTTEAAGLVEVIRFQSGERVAAGAVLVELDTDIDQADLKTLQAQLKLAETELGRTQQLVAQNNVAKSEFDRAASEVAQARARVEASRARLAQKVVRAPFAGGLGIRQVDLGQYVNPGTPLVTLQSLDPIYVNFTLPEQRLAEVVAGLPVKASFDAFPGTHFEGAITAIEPRVDEQTRNFNVQATLPNPEGRLQPGLFARMEVVLPGMQSFIVVPQTAISYNPYGNSVYVIHERKPKTDTEGQPDTQDPSQPPGGAQAAADGQTPELVVTQRFIKTGLARGDFVAVLEGLKPGERVATSGLLKLRNDAQVTVNNQIKPDAQLNPTPTDG